MRRFTCMLLLLSSSAPQLLRSSTPELDSSAASHHHFGYVPRSTQSSLTFNSQLPGSPADPKFFGVLRLKGAGTSGTEEPSSKDVDGHWRAFSKEPRSQEVEGHNSGFDEPRSQGTVIQRNSEARGLSNSGNDGQRSSDVELPKSNWAAELSSSGGDLEVSLPTEDEEGLGEQIRTEANRLEADRLKAGSRPAESEEVGAESGPGLARVPETEKLKTEVELKVLDSLWASANQGNSTAMRLLGGCLRKGIGRGGKPDLELSFQCYLSAAQQGDVDSQFNVGVCYARGLGVDQDQVRATSWFERAAIQGDPEANFQISVRLTQGLGIEEDLLKSTEHLVMAAEAGHVNSQYNLGLRYASGLGMAARSKFDPEHVPPVIRDLGLERFGFMDRTEFRKGNMTLYDEPQGTDGFPRADIAVEWFKQAAGRGHCKATFQLARHFLEGEGVPRTEQLALDLLRQAAEQGNVKAQYVLGKELGLQEAKSSQPNHTESLFWIHKAAYNGHSKALYSLGLRSAHGTLGLQRNLDVALRFFKEASLLGHMRAKDRYVSFNRTLYRQRHRDEYLAEQVAAGEKRRQGVQEQDIASRLYFPGVDPIDQARSQDILAKSLKAASGRPRDRGPTLKALAGYVDPEQLKPVDVGDLLSSVSGSGESSSEESFRSSELQFIQPTSTFASENGTQTPEHHLDPALLNKYKHLQKKLDEEDSASHNFDQNDDDSVIPQEILQPQLGELNPLPTAVPVSHHAMHKFRQKSGGGASNLHALD